MKTIALLTGRGNNTLKDKNILPVLGQPLLYYPSMAAKSCDLISDFYVSSDDEKILQIAGNIGYKKIKRPCELSQATTQHIDVIHHALNVIKKNGNYPDVLVVLLANSGIIKTEWITESIKKIERDPKISAVVPVIEEMDHHPFRSKKLRDDGFLDTWFDFSRESISTNRQDLPKNYILCHNFWTLNLKNSLFSNERGQQPWTFMGNKILPLIVEESFDVHTEDDIYRTEKWLKENKIRYFQ